MACLDIMYNSSDHHHNNSYTPMSPRISFSNDFAESQHIIKQQQQERLSSREAAAPVSSDFEFSVSNYSMMSADELFFKGKLLPFKDNCSNQMPRTLRDELLVDDNNEVSLRPPKGSSSSSSFSSTRWRGLLGLKKSHIGSKKADKNSGTDGSVKSTQVSKTPQDLLSEGGSSCRDVEIGI